MAELDKASLARLICDNGDDFKTIGLDAFRPQEKSDQSGVKCSEVPSLNLRAWKE